MAQFQLKLNKVDAMILGRLLQLEYNTVLSYFNYHDKSIVDKERAIIKIYLDNLSEQLLKFGIDERFEQTEKATKVEQYDFASKLRIKLFKEKYGLFVLSQTKQQKVLKHYGINHDVQPNKQTNKQANRPN